MMAGIMTNEQNRTKKIKKPTFEMSDQGNHSTCIMTRWIGLIAVSNK